MELKFGRARRAGGPDDDGLGLRGRALPRPPGRDLPRALRPAHLPLPVARHGLLRARSRRRRRGRTRASSCVSFDSDWRFGTEHSRHLARELEALGADVRRHEVASPWGHDSFLMDLPEYHALVTAFLAETRRKLHNADQHCSLSDEVSLCAHACSLLALAATLLARAWPPAATTPSPAAPPPGRPRRRPRRASCPEKFQKPVKIALVRQLASGDFFQQWLLGANEQAKALNIDLQISDARNNNDQQATDLQRAIDQKPARDHRRPRPRLDGQPADRQGGRRPASRSSPSTSRPRTRRSSRSSSPTSTPASGSPRSS